MRMPRVIGYEGSYYHCVSRVVDRNRIFGNEEKEIVRKIMRKVADFTGIRIVTYSIMSNHIHLLLQVPAKEKIDDAELMKRIHRLYGKAVARNIEFEMSEIRKNGTEKDLDEFREKYLYRMYDLSEFMKTFMQRVTMWYNGSRKRKGTLWEDRFKSVLIEAPTSKGKTPEHCGALAMMASYIDLNAVRAGIVEDPKDYRFCGYGEAVGGGSEAREGIKQVMRALGQDGAWSEVGAGYRSLLYVRGEDASMAAGSAHGAARLPAPAGAGSGSASNTGFSHAKVKAVLKKRGKLDRMETLRCRVRYFSDGVALGSKEYVNGIFEKYRDRFSEKRQDGARKMKWGDFGGLCSLRNLQVNVISLPAKA